MSDLQRAPNPYGPPSATDGGDDRSPAPGARVDGELLVLCQGTPLPWLCVKCGGSDRLEYYSQCFRYQPTWAKFVGIFGVSVGVKQSVFPLPLCPACHAMWTKWDRLAGRAFLLPVLGVCAVVYGLVSLPAETHVPRFALVVALMTGLVVGKSLAQSRRRRHVVSSTRIERHETWLRGVHEVVVRALLASPARDLPVTAREPCR